MKLTFRWYSNGDNVKLEHIRQIPGMTGVVTAVYSVPVGGMWPREEIARIKKETDRAGLGFEVVESVPVHEDIKIGAPSRDALIENYCENIRRLSEAGVKCVCYNFMPVFDWLRSDLFMELPDGSSTLAYDNGTVSALDPAKSELSLPGWDESYTKEALRALLDKYKNIDEEKLWENFSYFINKVIPVCEQADVTMAIHPDDPPWGIFGLPRIITGLKSYERMAAICPNRYNGITLCFGSLGADPDNDIESIIKTIGTERIHFVHARNILVTGERCFHESAHMSDCGSLDMYKLLKALHDGGFDGYIRPDHGRMIWDERGRAGYGLYDRALGAVYIGGLWEAISKESGLKGMY